MELVEVGYDVLLLLQLAALACWMVGIDKRYGPADRDPPLSHPLLWSLFTLSYIQYIICTMYFVLRVLFLYFYKIYNYN